ncbi:hypothetical protein ONA00_02225 [Mycoplasmopsis cynos]|nr:hypothetical protein [Mycoplasmopsis cynos]WAM11279.1 hypothetical protein ONA00_02225 [Mycoplasmopsis cynos]
MKAFLTSVFGKEKQDEIADALMGKDIFQIVLLKRIQFTTEPECRTLVLN